MMADAQNGKLTGIPLAMLDLLRDGAPHSMAEMKLLLYEQDAPDQNVHSHITKIRKHICPKGMDIVFRSSQFFLVRMLVNPYRD